MLEKVSRSIFWPMYMLSESGCSKGVRLSYSSNPDSVTLLVLVPGISLLPQFPFRSRRSRVVRCRTWRHVIPFSKTACPAVAAQVEYALNLILHSRQLHGASS